MLYLFRKITGHDLKIMSGHSLSLHEKDPPESLKYILCFYSVFITSCGNLTKKIHEYLFLDIVLKLQKLCHEKSLS